jgi:uncharacterized protein
MTDTPHIVDRRGTQGRSTPNRQRVIRRIEQQIKDAIPDIVDGNSIQDIGKDGRGINIPIKGLNEPVLQHDPELGKRHRVYTGNDQFVTGDKIPKPLGGDEGGKEGSPEGESEDDFFVSISREEFLEYFFKDLELPNMEQREQAESVDHYEWEHAGRIRYGIPARLNVIRSMSNSLGRRIALQTIFKKRVVALEERLELATEEAEISAIMEALVDANKKLRTIPFVDEVDLRYDHYKKVPIPIDRAVMFCLMDVSASMSKEEKDIAKRFYFFLYLMLEANYTQVDIVWIRHHVLAKRVSEDDFFNSRESGGTVVSSALELADSIKWNGDDLSVGGYPTKNWNIFFAQASDGDNYYDDMSNCTKLLTKIMKYVNYYAYVQIRSPGEENLWAEYAKIQEMFPKKFQMRHIHERKEIWKVFKDFFEKNKGDKKAAFGSF